MDPPPSTDPTDVLAQPTRARLFKLLSELRRAAGTGELAQLLELHPNGVRVQLERLERAGLLVRERTRQARGRPRDSWSIAPEARPGGSAPRAYADLARWLARATPTGGGGLGEIEATGREIGRELAPERAGAKPLRALEATLGALGFQPALQVEETGDVTFCLSNCPYRDAVRENSDLICTLHRGMTRGLLDVLAPGAELSAFVPKDPDHAGCLIELSGALE